jgi:hypothetical protein
VSLYTGDEPAAPSAKSWTPVAVGVSVEALNHKRLDRPFSRLSKYLLIETDFSQSGPIYSLYLYGEKSAVAYNLEKRDGSADVHAAYGKFVNDQTAINESALYANGRVTSSNGAESPVNLQRAIDDNPETVVSVSPSATDNGMVVRFAQGRSVNRVSLLSSAPVKGKVEIYAMTDDSATDTATAKATATITLDGANPRGSVEFPTVSASAVALRWVPETAGEKLGVSEINSFGAVTLADYRISQAGAVASAGSRRDVSKGDGDGKEALAAVGEFKGGKDLLPVAEGPGKSPYIPGGLRPPPIITEDPVSP